ncbi:MAG: Gfo/Idh/MocA family oxidoreductase [Dehalococcoidia bacterium]
MAVRVGVIGGRFGAKVHIPAFLSEGYELVAVCTRREESAKATADEFGVPNIFTDYNEMLRMPGLDAVAVVTPPALHHPIGMAALEAGKHVVCEKPFTLNAKEAHSLWRKAEDTGLTAMIAHEFRFASARARVAELVQEGYIGTLHTCLVNLFLGARFDRVEKPITYDDIEAEGGGLLWGQGSHSVDCLRHWFGDVTSVFGKVSTHLPQRTDPQTGAPVQATADDAFMARLEFAKGGWASMTFNYAAGFGEGSRIEIYGSEGTLVTPEEPGARNPAAHGTVLGARIGDKALQELPIPERLEPFEDDRDVRLMPMRLLVREFERGIQEGHSPSPSFHDAFRNQQVLDAIRESSVSGREVRIPLGE